MTRQSLIWPKYHIYIDFLIIPVILCVALPTFYKFILMGVFSNVYFLSIGPLIIDSPYRILARPIELDHIVENYPVRASTIAQFIYPPPKEIPLRVTDVLSAD